MTSVAYVCTKARAFLDTTGGAARPDGVGSIGREAGWLIVVMMTVVPHAISHQLIAKQRALLEK